MASDGKDHSVELGLKLVAKDCVLHFDGDLTTCSFLKCARLGVAHELSTMPLHISHDFFCDLGIKSTQRNGSYGDGCVITKSCQKPSSLKGDV